METSVGGSTVRSVEPVIVVVEPVVALWLAPIVVVPCVKVVAWPPLAIVATAVLEEAQLAVAVTSWVLASV
jgi:hypothetical protein